MSLGLFHDTIAAIATPEGRSALAIVRISGPEAIAIVSRIASEPEAVWAARTGSSIYTGVRGPGSGVRDPGTGDREPGSEVRNSDDLPALLHTEHGTRNTEPAPLDDVIIHIHRTPRSFTGEDLCEITPHGSPVIARQILDLLVAHGARQAEPGEFSRRAFFNGKIGLEDAELISVKADAQSGHELRGSALALHEKYARLREAYMGLIGLIGLIDAEIDFGESDQIEISDFAGRLESVTTSLNQLIRDSTNRRENAGYFTVALTGPPNVGKSSVFNALLNFERSIVSEIPGTTRDYVEAFINVDGFRVKLIDTAGLREAGEALEERGIELGIGAARHADISLRVTDPQQRSPILTNGVQLLHNKIDLDRWGNGLRLSALTGEGLESVHKWLLGELLTRSAEWSLIRLSESERSRLDGISNQLKNVGIDMEPAILSEELRLSAEGLAELLGLNMSSDSLDHIFSKMCIGK